MRFRLLAGGQNGNFIEIETPFYDTNSFPDFEDVFAIGPHNIGRKTSEYYISIYNDGRIYRMCEETTEYQINILKTEEKFDGVRNVLYVWMQIQDIPLNDCNSAYDDTLRDAVFLAKFFNHRNFDLD